MKTDTALLSIAIAGLKGHINQALLLAERLSTTMRYVRQHQGDLFFLLSNIDDDLMFKTAMAGVMLTATQPERDLLTRSLQPLKFLGAAMAGIPVEIPADGWGDDLLPIMKLWHESADQEPIPAAQSRTGNAP